MIKATKLGTVDRLSWLRGLVALVGILFIRSAFFKEKSNLAWSWGDIAFENLKIKYLLC
jgi:hypothetical protein